jgi:peptide methionine sulfoxide reductase MsrA
MSDNTETAILAGGCFWGVQELLRHRDGKVVTEISEAVPFWEAEPEHQDYLQRYPNGYTCHFPRPGWTLPHRETAA